MSLAFPLTLALPLTFTLAFTLPLFAGLTGLGSFLPPFANLPGGFSGLLRGRLLLRSFLECATGFTQSLLRGRDSHL